MPRIVWVLMLVLTATFAWADKAPGSANPDPAAQAPLGESDHEALRALMAELVAALNSLDGPALTQHLAQGFVLTFADQSVITEQAQLDAYIGDYFKADGAPLQSVQFVPEAAEKVRFIDSRTGVVHGDSADTYTLTDGSSLTLDTRWTATVIKEDGRWLVQTFHAGVNMLDNPILHAAGKSSLTLGGAGLLVGLLLGALAMRMFRRQ